MFKNKKYEKLKFKKTKKSFLPYKREVFGILLFSFFVILTLSFITYNPTDNSWFYFSSGKKTATQNLIGFMGANLSAFFFYLFGSAAYVFNLFLLFFAYVLFFNKKLSQEWDRGLALCLFLISGVTFLKIYDLDFSSSYPGGLAGYGLLNIFSFFMADVGTKIFIFTSFIVSSIIFFRISFSYIAIKGFEWSWFLLKGIGINIFYLVGIGVQKLLGSLMAVGAFFLGNLKNIFTRNNEYDTRDQPEEFFYINTIKTARVAPKENKVWDSFQKLAHEVPEYDSSVNLKDFKSKIIYLKSYVLNFSKYNFIFLQNSVFDKNIFDSNCIELLEKYVDEKNREKILNAKNLNSNAEFKKRIEYELPDLSIFNKTTSKDQWMKELEQESIERGKKLEEKLGYFGIKGKITAVRPGPVITLFEYKPEIDSKISKIVALEDDLAMALTALSIRIVAPIPGKNVIGFEISNKNRESVFLSEILLSEEFKKSKAKLPLSLGVDIVGKPVIDNLVKMPHLLVAGSTGSGKSVGMNSMLVSLLCRLRPDQLKLILIDPKRLEFAPYADIPHLLFPIITNPRNAAPVLKWLVQEMEERYDRLAAAGVKNVSEYQKLSKENPEYPNMPFIVLMIDELADLMMVAGKDIETQIARIAQMARAAGIHMIVATQRPSVDVVTGIIKVNFPSRIAYRVSSKIDSRTIIDDKGAEKLLGMGDLLYMNSVSSDLNRIHGAYVSDQEIEKLTTHLKQQQKVEYLDLNDALRKVEQKDLEKFEDELYPEILEFIKTKDEISISQLQRYYKIGFNRSARIIERLELDGILAPAQGSKPRRIIRD